MTTIRIHKLLPIALVLFITQTSTPSFAATPAWCTADTLTPVEQTICDDTTLSQADALLDQLYRAVLSFRGLEGHEGMWPGEIISDQREWIEQRNTLQGRSEILEAYSNRIQTLTQVLKLRWQPLKP